MMTANCGEKKGKLGENIHGIWWSFGSFITIIPFCSLFVVYKMHITACITILIRRCGGFTWVFLVPHTFPHQHQHPPLAMWTIWFWHASTIMKRTKKNSFVRMAMKKPKEYICRRASVWTMETTWKLLKGHPNTLKWIVNGNTLFKVVSVIFSNLFSFLLRWFLIR